jgi:hypothetical protein
MIREYSIDCLSLITENLIPTSGGSVCTQNLIHQRFEFDIETKVRPKERQSFFIRWEKAPGAAIDVPGRTART